MGNLAMSFSQAFSGLRTSVQTDEASVLLLPPARPSSLGDAAEVSASAACLRSAGQNRLTLMCDSEWHQLDEKFDQFIASGKGKLKLPFISRWLSAGALYNHSLVSLIGGNLSGAVAPRLLCQRLSLLAEAAQAGVATRLISCGFYPQGKVASEYLLQSLKNLPAATRIYARDSLSQLALGKLLGRRVYLAADAALLLPPRPEHPLADRALAWIAAQRSAGNHVLGLSISQLPGRAQLKNLREFIARVMQKNMALVLLPMAASDEEAQAELYQQLTGLLDAKARQRLYTLSGISPGIVRAVLEDLDLCICDEYQAGVLSLAAATPLLALGESADLRSLVQSFHLDAEEMLVRAANPQVSELELHLLDILAHKAQLRLHLQRQLLQQKPLAQRNFN